MYEEKQRGGATLEKVMFSLIWDIEELKRLNNVGRKLRTEILTALDILSMPQPAQMEHNLSRKLCSVRTSLQDVVKGLHRFMRTSATHMFVFMISSALRDRKPYAIPIQCIPYAGLKESDMRRLVNSIIKEMTSQGMAVAGMCMCIHCSKTLCLCACAYARQYNYVYIYIHVCMSIHNSYLSVQALSATVSSIT